jgi:hypothetical protein
MPNAGPSVECLFFWLARSHKVSRVALEAWLVRITVGAGGVRVINRRADISHRPEVKRLIDAEAAM